MKGSFEGFVGGGGGGSSVVDCWPDLFITVFVGNLNL